MDAAEASSTFIVSTRSDVSSEERIVLTSMGAADGLERLFVIVCGMDQGQGDGDLTPPELEKQRDTTRSLIYRAMSRAQFYLFLLNHQCPNGFFSFLNKVGFGCP